MSRFAIQEHRESAVTNARSGTVVYEKEQIPWETSQRRGARNHDVRKRLSFLNFDAHPRGRSRRSAACKTRWSFGGWKKRKKKDGRGSISLGVLRPGCTTSVRWERLTSGIRGVCFEVSLSPPLVAGRRYDWPIQISCNKLFPHSV